MVAVDFAGILSAASLQADRDTFAPGRLQLAECFLQRHDADALPSRRDCGAFGIIPMLTSLDLPGLSVTICLKIHLIMIASDCFRV